MSQYFIQSALPKFTVIHKENIPSLQGTVITQKYYLTINDYQQLYLTVNGIANTFNTIYSVTNISFLNDNQQLDRNVLTAGINNIIEKYFICIKQLNGHTISTTQDRQIYVVDKICINGTYYSINDQNKGHIVLPNRYISGTPDDYVQAFNGRKGDVKGAIEEVILNGRTCQMVDGRISIEGIILKGRYVVSVNGASKDIYLLSAIIYQDTSLYAHETNQGRVTISNYFYKNVNNNLSSDIKLNNVDPINANTAVTKGYLKDNINNESIAFATLVGTSFTLAAGWYPLHFYDANGNWLSDVKWTINDRTVTLTNATNVASYSIMKVTN